MTDTCEADHEPRLIVLLEAASAPGRARERLTTGKWRDGVVTVETAGNADAQDRDEDLLAAFGITWHEPGQAGAWDLVADWYARRSLVGRIVFLDAERFTARRWRETVAFHQRGHAATLICHSGARLPEHARESLAHVAHTVAASSDQVLALFEPTLAPSSAAYRLDEIIYPAPPVPDGFPAAPRSTFPHFRAHAYRILDPRPFTMLDTQYRYGARAAGAWIRTRPAYAEAASARAAHAHRHLLPYLWEDQDALEVFLSALVGEVADPEASVARVRGAQAGLLRHGLLLTVPDHLRDQPGPGFSGQVLTPEACRVLTAHLPYPLHAARAVLTVLIGVGGRDLDGVWLDDDDEHGAVVTHVGHCYAVPPYARPVLHAARAYLRLEESVRTDPLLLTGTLGPCQFTKPCRDRVGLALAACGLTAPGPASRGRAPSAWRRPPTGPWHAEARCEFVADPLPGAPERAFEPVDEEWP